jgi:PrsW family intramembrane metalloprotease
VNNSAPKPDRLDLALLIGALLGVLGSMAGFVGAMLIAISSAAQHDSQGIVFGAWVASGFIGLGLCGVPALILAGRSLFGLSAPAPNRPRFAFLGIVVLFPVAILAGVEILRGPDLARILFPAAQLIAAGVPVLAGVILMRASGPRLSPRRSWAQFLVGLWGMPWLAMLLEVMALIPALAILGIGLVNSPSGQHLLRQLLDATNSQAPTALDQPVLQLMLNPWVAATLLGYIAVAVPLIEEAIKSMAIWPFLGRKVAPSVAFVSGALGGAGYALFEALFLTQPADTWASTMFGRSGASIMHTFTAGLTCWGLAEGFSRHRWGRALFAYLGAVAMHGLWNASAVGAGLASAASESGSTAISIGAATAITTISATIMVGLSTFALICLPLIATRLTRREARFAAEG